MEPVFAVLGQGRRCNMIFTQRSGFDISTFALDSSVRVHVGAIRRDDVGC